MSVLDDEGDRLLEDTAPTGPGGAAQSKVLFMSTDVKAAGGGKSKKKPPGSRAKSEPSLSEEEAAQLDAARMEAIASDPVVQKASGTDPLSLLSILKGEVAKEAAELAFQRSRLAAMGKDITSVSGRRIDALKKIADIEMEMRKIGFDVVDVHGAKFQMVFKFWIETIREAAEDVLDEKTVDLFFNRLMTAMEGWEAKAEELVR